MTWHSSVIELYVKERIAISTDGCWNWLLAVNHDGYGKATWQYKCHSAHRLAWLGRYGSLNKTKNYGLDHLCNNRRCVNPDHLVESSIKENVLRPKTGVTAVNARKKLCKNGHKFTTIVKGWYGPQRRCKICAAAAQKRHRVKSKNDARTTK